jgi:hypothetical protein
MMIKMATMAMMKDHTLQDLMSEADYKRLSQFVKDTLGMPMMLFTVMSGVLPRTPGPRLEPLVVVFAGVNKCLNSTL